MRRMYSKNELIELINNSVDLSDYLEIEDLGDYLKTINGTSIVGEGDIEVGGSVYQHFIKLSGDSSNTNIYISIIRDNDTQLTISDLQTLLSNKEITCSGIVWFEESGRDNFAQAESIQYDATNSVFSVKGSTLGRTGTLFNYTPTLTIASYNIL